MKVKNDGALMLGPACMIRYRTIQEIYAENLEAVILTEKSTHRIPQDTEEAARELTKKLIKSVYEAETGEDMPEFPEEEGAPE